MLSKRPLPAVASCLALTASLYAEGAYAASKQEYVQQASTGIRALNDNWYDQGSGLWDGAWWQSGNALTTMADFALLQPGAANSLGIPQRIQNTFRNAPKKFPGYINEFYDDEGWWALGLIHSYDAMGDGAHLETAVDIFNDMQTGRGGPCKGGIYWKKDRKYVNAVSNELYLAVAASLANRIPSNKTYAQIAKDEWSWFRQSGIINGQNLVNDGLNDQCKNNGLQTWSYIQGVILGALVELSKPSLLGGGALDQARTLAKAAIGALSNKDGILVETDKCETREGNCGFDAKQFKGVFIRNLGYLNQAIGDGDIRSFILRNADSVWTKNRGKDNKMGVAWAGPVVGVNGASHGSAVDALVAAVRAS